MSCFVCHSPTISVQGHHIIPQSDGGTEGPVVDLCGGCHQLIHTGARRVKRNKSVDDLIAHLNEDAKQRALGLINIIVMADIKQPQNPHPLIAAVLDHPCYLLALKKFQSDAGFTSQEKAINGILRGLALKYGLLETPANTEVKTAKLRQVAGLT